MQITRRSPRDGTDSSVACERRFTSPRARTAALLTGLVAVAALLAACAQNPPGGGTPRPLPPVGEVQLREVVSGLAAPAAIANAGDERLFVVEREGRIRVVADGALLPEPLLDISDRVSAEPNTEQGVLGLAFPPDHATSSAFYVYYTNSEGVGTLSRFHVSGDPNVADPAEEVLVTLEEPAEFHNGGQLAFGPDGLLYWAVGDGGDGGVRAQSLATLRGKLLRLDVSGAAEYTVPAGNPFVGEEGARGEIWAYGLRNPWRFSFDRETGALYLADVGEDDFEEVNVVAGGAGGLAGGQNFGWPTMEGPDCMTSGCDRTGLTLPTLAYPHPPGGGASVTGGYVYRGARAPELVGHYVFADFMSGELFTASAADDWRVRPLLEPGFLIATLGEGADGALYVADFVGGDLYEITQMMP